MSRRSSAASQAEAPGQDSFLDVVANLVGIFLILIIIVGSQAKNAVESARGSLPAPPVSRSPSPSIELKQRLEQSSAEARQTAADLQSLQDKLNENQFELAYRRKELEQSTLQIQLAQKAIDQERAKLSDNEQASISAQVELKSLLEKQAELEADIARLAAAPKNVEVVENLPSPKVRKSSVGEIEFRLKGGKLMYVPMLEIQKDVLKDMERAAPELRNRNEIMRSVGAVRGFHVHYRLYLEERQVVAANGMQGVLQKPEADMQLEPVDENGGETVEDALLADSEMNRRLRENPPGTSTITLWVYPDSFKHFRKLRDALYKQGYLVAARPLPAGQPIGASTKGERSVGQ